MRHSAYTQILEDTKNLQKHASSRTEVFADEITIEDDPNEWKNIAAKSPTPAHAKVIAQLKKHLPKINATQRGNEPKE